MRKRKSFTTGHGKVSPLAILRTPGWPLRQDAAVTRNPDEQNPTVGKRLPLRHLRQPYLTVMVNTVETTAGTCGTWF